MKKISIVLGCLVVALAISNVGVSKSLKDLFKGMRGVAQEGATEKEIGSVKAFERTFGLSFDACKENTRVEETKDWSKITCEVLVFPKSDEDQGLSTSLDGQDTHITIKKSSSDYDLKAHLDVDHDSFEIHTDGWDNKTPISKEEFLAAAQQLINKFPKVSTKFIKVVH